MGPETGLTPFSGVAGEALGQEGGDDLSSAGIGGAGGVVAPALLLVAARAREGQVARIVRAGQARRQLRRGTMAKPAAGDDVLERRGAEGFAIPAAREMSAAVQTPRAAQATFGSRLRIGVEREADQLPERARHAVGSAERAVRQPLTAVDDQRGAVDIGCAIRTEEQRRVRDVVDGAESPERICAHRPVTRLLWQ